MKVLLRSSLNSVSERGSDSFEFIAALTDLGIDVYLEPTVVRPPLSAPVASMLTKKYPPYYDLAIHYVAPSESISSPKTQIPSGLNVLWTWHDSSNMYKWDVGAPLNRWYDAVLCQDEVTYSAVEGLYKDIPLGVLTPGFTSTNWPYVNRDWYEPFVFGMVLTGSKRENPEMVIQTFHNMTKDHDEFSNCQLVIKTIPEDTLNPALEENIAGLTIIKSNWGPRDFNAFYREVNCLIFSDSGGVRNKAAQEYMSTGGTVIATKWGINKMWLSEAYSWPIKPDMVEQGGKKNSIGYPDSFDLRQTMLKVVRSENVQNMGRTASENISMFDWANVVDDLFITLNDVAEEKGKKLYQKYKSLEVRENEGRI